MIRETAHVFGSHGGLAGVLCEPAGERSPNLPAVVFWNVGLNHRVGPNRTWVEFARALAQHGFPSLRFDLSGFGDSEPRRDATTDSERAALDLVQALDFLAQRGVATRFVLVANCSGVDPLHTVLARDPRVAGAVYIDGYAYRNSGYRWRRQLGRWLQPKRWRRFVRQRASGNGRLAAALATEEVWKRDLPARERFAADVDAFVARGVALLFVYTGGFDLHYNYKRQFHDMFGHQDAIDVEYYPRFDHLLSLDADRRVVESRLCRWITRAFPAHA